MYEFLRGQIFRRLPTLLVVEAAGVGYSVQIPLSTYSDLPEEGEAFVWLHHQVSENEVALYGFATEVERRLFRALIGVKGVGPRLAIQILSGTTPDLFVVALRDRDVASLTRIKGIGKKTAERILVELSGRLILNVGGDSSSSEKSSSGSSTSSLHEDGIRAMVALGISESEADRVLASVQKEWSESTAPTLELLVREGLRRCGSMS